MSRQVKTALSVAVVLIAIIFGLSATGTLDGLLRTLDVASTGETAVEQTPPASTGPAAEAPPTGTDTAVIAERVVPIFDLIRVEPDGAAVMAGQGAPNATVEILSNDGVVASGKATAEGSWAIVLEDPLAAGAHDIRVRATSPDGASVIESEQRVAVSVPEGGAGEVLVVLNQPGTASAVLQLPGSEGGAITAVTPPATDAPQSSGAAASTGASVATTVDAPPPADTADVSPPAAAEPAPDAPAVATADPATDAPTSAETAVSPGPSAPPSTTTANAATSPATQDAAAAAGETDVAASAPAGTEDNSTDVASAEPGVAASSEPSSERVTAASGADAANAAAANTAGADSAAPASPGTATADAGRSDPVAGRGSEAGQTLAAVQPDAAGAGEGAVTGGSAAAAVDAPAAPTVTVEAVEIENATMLFAAGAAPRGARVRLYIDDLPVGDAIAGAGDRWLLQQVISPLAPGSHRVRADMLDGAGGVSARAEVNFDFRDAAVAAGPPVAEPAGEAAAASPDAAGTIVSSSAATVAGSGTGAAAVGSGDEGEARVGQPASIIIRTGDNLWTISRRLYGRGVRYSTIYLANTDQIRSPHLIYPGQVFVLPAGDANWPAEPAPAAAGTPAPAAGG